MPNNNYNTLVEKLSQFKRTYYFNQLISGSFLTVALVFSLFLLANLAEYFGHFSELSRSVIFYGFLLSAVGVLIRYVLFPVSKLLSMGKTLSNREVAKIVGDFFPEINDKIINTLQLRERVSLADANSIELLEASVSQKTKELNPVPFLQAIDKSKNRRYLKYTIPPLLVLAFILAASPRIITNSSERLLNYNSFYQPQAPFSFVLQNDSLVVVEQSDFTLEVKIEGDVVPNTLYITAGNNSYRLKKKGNRVFEYVFNNVQKPVDFYLSGDEFNSQEYTLATLPHPSVTNFYVALNYPKYTGKKPERIQNIGDLNIPEGTEINWAFQAKNTTQVRMLFPEEIAVLEPNSQGRFTYTKNATNNEHYAVTLSNDKVKTSDSIAYRLNVLADVFPGIDVTEASDSLLPKRLYFNGNISDDYGFTNLVFSYQQIKDANGKAKVEKPVREPISFSRNATNQIYFHAWDFSELSLEPGDVLEYYFEVWDNDGVSGAKSSRTEIKVFKAPTLKELSEKTENSNAEIKDNLEKSAKDVMQLRKEFDELQKDLYDKKSLSWQDKQRIQELLNKQKELEKQINNAQQENKQKLNEQQEYADIDEELLKKQEELQKLMEEVLTEEMKKMIEELEKLMEEMNKETIQEKLDDIEMSNEQLEKELDRSLELFKKLELDMKLEETANKLEKLAEKQEELSEESKEKGANKEELAKEQEKLNEEFEDIKKDLEAIDEKNKELERPKDLDETKEQQESIEKKMQDSKEQLDDKKGKKASESQKGASEEMQQLSEDMKQMISNMQSMQMQEDMDAIRQLLENLLTLSFDQEKLMTALKTTNIKDPKYVSLGKEQRKLKDDAKIIEDSLFALSKRVAQIRATVNHEISEINHNMEKAIDDMADRQTSNAVGRQQFVMTSTNNLALLLDDALQQMQKQQASKMPGSGMCQKPGQGKPSPASLPSLKSLQDQLGKQLDQLKKQGSKGDKGKKPGGKAGDTKIPGGKQGKGSGGQGKSEQLSRAAAQQAAIREQLNKIGQQYSEQGKSDLGNQLKKIAKEMEQIEKDLVNDNVSQQTIKRQQEIMTRLLESEKAEQEREYSEKRKSNEAKNYEKSNPNAFLEYKRMKEKETELLKTIPPNLKPYYKKEVNKYFNSIEE